MIYAFQPEILVVGVVVVVGRYLNLNQTFFKRFIKLTGWNEILDQAAKSVLTGSVCSDIEDCSEGHALLISASYMSSFCQNPKEV